MTDLSPAAQAVLDAYGGQVGGSAAITSYERRGIAAAFKTAADILRQAYANEELMDPADDWLNDIATELENCND